MLCICPTTNKLVCAHNTFLYKIVPYYFIYTLSDLHMSLMRMLCKETTSSLTWTDKTNTSVNGDSSVCATWLSRLYVYAVTLQHTSQWKWKMNEYSKLSSNKQQFKNKECSSCTPVRKYNLRFKDWDFFILFIFLIQWKISASNCGKVLKLCKVDGNLISLR